MQRYKKELFKQYGSYWGMTVYSNHASKLPVQCPVSSARHGKFDAGWYSTPWRAEHATCLLLAGELRYARQQGGSYWHVLQHSEQMNIAGYLRFRFKGLPE